MYGRKVKLRILFLVALILSIILTIFLILKSLEENVVYFLSPTEVKSLNELTKDKIRIGGMVKENSINISSEKINFIITDFNNEINVMYLGRMVETGTPEEIFSSPKHPYTEALISAVPQADPDVVKNHKTLIGEIPNPSNPPSGCYFHPRCSYATDECKKTNLNFYEVSKEVNKPTNNSISLIQQI